jgi:hypothetical protein
MDAARKLRRMRPRAKSLGDCLRQFLTPAVWKQAQNVLFRPWQASRWEIQPLVMVLLLSTFACGDSQPERFETARAVVVALRPKRRRPGETVQGYQMALRRLPMFVLRIVAVCLRGHLAETLARRWLTDGFVVLGCDGSRLECARTPELEGRLGQAGKNDSAPTMWLTAIVHLATGVPFSWRFGKGTASERDHLRHLLTTLPEKALLVCDAGYTGYELARDMLGRGVDFLIRMSSTVTLYTEKREPLTRYREGIVYYWTDKARKQGGLPLRLRLIRVEGKKRTKRGTERYDVWLLTSVLEKRHLLFSAASRYYRWRWENEGYFRSYKRTLSMVKLSSRTVSLAHREAEGSMLAVQLLLAITAAALPRCSAEEAPKGSPRKAVLEFRKEFQHLAACRRRRHFGDRLSQASRERRPGRSSDKASRPWPGRTPHTPPKRPQILTLGKLKNLLKKALNNAA